MAISQGMVTSFKTELLDGIHAFGTSVIRAATTADTYKIALYTITATLDATTTVYSVTDEVVGTGYTAGGEILTVSQVPTSTNTTAWLSFTNASWPASTITAAGALIYNSTQGDKAVAILSFGANKSSTASTFTVVFPAADSTSAIVRIS